MKKRLEDLRGALHVEGHFEGITDDKFDNEFGVSVPKGPYTHHGIGIGFQHPNAPGITFYWSRDEDVSVIRAGANTFGFYTKANLVDAKDYASKFTRLREFYRTFQKNVTNNIRQAHSFEAKFKPDFMFDFSKQNAFHPDGVLSSSAAAQTSRDHPDLRETADWLRKRRGAD